MKLQQWGRYRLPDGTVVEASQTTSEPKRWNLLSAARPDAPLYVEDERRPGSFFYLTPADEPGTWAVTPSDLTIEDLTPA